MKILNMEQGTPEWHAARAGIPTASEMDVLVTATGKIADNEGVRTYLYRKLAERWRGRPIIPRPTTFAMEQGKILEEHALPFCALEYGWNMQRVGFITDDAGTVGCSPDSWLGEEGAEIKAPEPHTHIKYLLMNALPAEYRGQVQASMMITGAAKWRFVSYCREFPTLMLTIVRDPVYIATLAKAVELFTANLDELYGQLVVINGGEPDRYLVSHTANTQTVSMPDVPDDAIEQFLNSKAAQRMGTA